MDLKEGNSEASTVIELFLSDVEFGNPEFHSELNQLMDSLLSQPELPLDYAATMMRIARDRSNHVIVRDFAVQHIGLYAQALNRNGTYSAESHDAENCRKALFDAARETDSIVAAAAFRALHDMSEFDRKIGQTHFDAILVSCAGDATACRGCSQPESVVPRSS